MNQLFFRETFDAAGWWADFFRRDFIPKSSHKITLPKISVHPFQGYNVWSLAAVWNRQSERRESFKNLLRIRVSETNLSERRSYKTTHLRSVTFLSVAKICPWFKLFLKSVFTFFPGFFFFLNTKMIIIVIYLCFRSWQQKVEEDRRDILELARKLQELCRFRVSETILGWNYTRSIKRSRMEGVDTKQVGEQMYRRRHFWPGFSEQFKEGRVIFQKTSFWTQFFPKT